MDQFSMSSFHKSQWIKSTLQTHPWESTGSGWSKLISLYFITVRDAKGYLYGECVDGFPKLIMRKRSNYSPSTFTLHLLPSSFGSLTKSEAILQCNLQEQEKLSCSFCMTLKTRKKVFSEDVGHNYVPYHLVLETQERRLNILHSSNLHWQAVPQGL